jgi:hypothetical protein
MSQRLQSNVEMAGRTRCTLSRITRTIKLANFARSHISPQDATTSLTLNSFIYAVPSVQERLIYSDRVSSTEPGREMEKKLSVLEKVIGGGN